MANKEVRAALVENFFMKYGPLIPQEIRKDFSADLIGMCDVFMKTSVEDYIEKFKAEGERLFGPSIS